MQEIPHGQLGQYTSDRRSLEVDVARAIAAHLCRHEHWKIRNMVQKMLDQILAVLDDPRTARLAQGILAKQKNYNMWSVVGRGNVRGGLMDVYKYVSYNRSEVWLGVCSDIIRLFGEFADQFHEIKNPGADVRESLARSGWDKLKTEKDALRVQPVYADPKKSSDGWGHRDRGENPNKTVIDEPYLPIDRTRVPWRGVERIKFQDLSVIQHIDYTYGLPVQGGDISGTTTDSIQAVKWASAGRGEVPTTQLIAIATMVPAGHHTIVECAWPLTRHGYMSYDIGFYGTLAPSGNGGLRGELEKFDSDTRNQHILACVEKIFLFNQPNEIRDYKEIAGIRRAYSICVAGKLDVRTAKNVLASHHASQAVIQALG
jgi:hypothetical protein